MRKSLDKCTVYVVGILQLELTGIFLTRNVKITKLIRMKKYTTHLNPYEKEITPLQKKHKNLTDKLDWGNKINLLDVFIVPRLSRCIKMPCKN